MVKNIAAQASEIQAIATGDLTTEIVVKSESDVVGKALALRMNLIR